MRTSEKRKEIELRAPSSAGVHLKPVANFKLKCNLNFNFQVDVQLEVDSDSLSPDEDLSTISTNLLLVRLGGVALRQRTITVARRRRRGREYGPLRP